MATVSRDPVEKSPDEFCTTVEATAEPDVLDGPSRDFSVIPIPRHLRHHPGKPFHFGLLMNIAFAIAGMFLNANLYYCQPLLIQMSKSFDVSYEGVSRIPTLIQTGYAIGILFISPLGDLIRRRSLILGLVTLTTFLTIGLSATKNVVVFEVFSFFLGMSGITPQILIPLAADLAPPEKRGFMYSIVATGLLLGLLLARVLAGVIGEFGSWQTVYYLAIGAQLCVLICSYFIIPDYPAKNKGTRYWTILWTMAKLAVTEPLLIQIIFINVATSACFASYWVTLTFLLGGPPYFYSTLVIGLFGLLGISAIATGPLAGRAVGHMHSWHVALIATMFLVVSLAVQTIAGGIHIAAVIISCFGLDAFRQVQNVALITMVFSISMDAVSRLNAIFVLSFYAGQLMGTSVGTKIFVVYGWRACAALSLSLFGLQVFILLLRGPHSKRYTWFGFEGGIRSKGNEEEQ